MSKQKKIVNQKKWMTPRSDVQSVNIRESLSRLNEEFYVYCPHPGLDTTPYLDENGVLDMDKVPDQHVFGFKCRYMDNVEFEEICAPNVPVKFDPSALKNKDLTEDLFLELLTQALEQKMKTPSDSEVVVECIYRCCLEPKFESAAEVGKILPLTIQDTLLAEIIKFVNRKTLLIK